MDIKQAILNRFEGNWADFYGQYVNIPDNQNESVKIRSPFREETDPSFHINLNGKYAGRWHDFGCSKDGDIFDFYALKHNLDCKTDFKRVLDSIVRDFGIPLNGQVEIKKKLPESRQKKTPEDILQGFRDALGGSEILNDLKIRRGISDETIAYFKLGRWHNKVVFPLRDISGCILGFKVHKGPHLKPDGTKAKKGEGIKAQLYPLSNLNADTMLICEGEPDVWRLHTEGREAVAGTAGAATWRESWDACFEDKDVTIVADNDRPGREMIETVIKALKVKAKTLRHLSWPEDLPEGFDITDWLQSGKTLDDLPLQEVAVKRLTLTAAKSTFARWLHFDKGEDALLDVILGAVVANRFQGDPVWLFIVGPPGGSKTETLRSLSNWPEIYTLSTLTASTLISGLVSRDGSDPSLLPKLDGKVLVIKDFTAILDMHREARQQILGDLRDAYDGEMGKAFGSEAGTRRYKSKFGLIGAVTPAIDRYTSVGQQLGERFLKFRLAEGGARDRVSRALQNSGREADMRRDLAEAAEGVLFACDIRDERQITIPADVSELIIDLADVLARLRSVVSRDGYTKAITYVPVPEIGTRLAKQFGKLARGVAVVRSKDIVDADEFGLLCRIARDTMPSNRKLIIHTLYRLFPEGGLSCKDVADEMGMPVKTVRYALEDLLLLKIVTRSGDSNLPDLWRMDGDVSDLLERLDFFGEGGYEMSEGRV